MNATTAENQPIEPRGGSPADEEPSRPEVDFTKPQPSTRTADDDDYAIRRTEELPPVPGNEPPPPGAFPPPVGGYGPAAAGGGLAARYGLVRPLKGRYLAGVCAAIGRATNTDPLLWRVLVAVLTLFGGTGLLLYLVGWLLIPAEGDTASPIEALLGRGRSRTSTAAVIAGIALTLIVFTGAFAGDLQATVLGAAVIIGAAVLVSRALTAHPHRHGFQPTGAQPPPPGGTSTPGYGPPFAPGGPYASSSPHASSGPYTSSGPYASPSPASPAGYGYPPPPPPEHPGVTPEAVPPPRPPKPRSPLGRMVLSLILIALGTLAAIDLATDGDVRGTAYLAVPLAVIGLGLVAGAWLGRARWLIVPGLAVMLALLAATSAESVDWNSHSGPTGSVTWAPNSVSDVNGDYQIDAGDAMLDLSRVDFTDRDMTVNVTANFGDLVVVLPPKVDVDVDARVGVGSMHVLGQEWDGFDKSSRRISNPGVDGPGGGHLHLLVNVHLGSLKVNR